MGFFAFVFLFFWVFFVRFLNKCNWLMCGCSLCVLCPGPGPCQGPHAPLEGTVSWPCQPASGRGLLGVWISGAEHMASGQDCGPRPLAKQRNAGSASCCHRSQTREAELVQEARGLFGWALSPRPVSAATRERKPVSQAPAPGQSPVLWSPQVVSTPSQSPSGWQSSLPAAGHTDSLLMPVWSLGGRG